MAVKPESNRLEMWEEQRGPSTSCRLTLLIAERPVMRLAEPFRACLDSGSDTVGEYDSIDKRDGRWTARGEVSCPDGTVVQVTDVWSRADNETLSVERRAAVVRVGSSDGVRVEFSAAAVSDPPSTFAEWDLFVPGALYGRNDSDGDGREDYLGTYVQMYRDDRLPSLAVLAFLPRTGRFVSLSRSSVPRRDPPLSDAKLTARRFVHDTDIGSLGLAPCGEGVELRASYPFAEPSSFCLNTSGQGWSAYLANRYGESFTVTYRIQAGTATTFTDAIYEVTRRQMSVLRTRTPKVAFSLEDSLQHRTQLTQRYYRQWDDIDGAAPAGYAVHFSPRTAETNGALLEYGFSGAQTLLAYTQIEYGHRHDALTQVRQGRSVIDFFVKHCQLDNGFVHGIYDTQSREFKYWFTGILTPFQYALDDDEIKRYLGSQMAKALGPIARELRPLRGNYMRTMCESMYATLCAYRTESERGVDHAHWMAAARSFAAFLLRAQQSDGSWNRAYDTQGAPIDQPVQWFGSSDVERKSGTIFPIEVLTLLFELTGEQQYLSAAERAGDFLIRTYVDRALYVGGLNDTTHIKSVKTDAVAVMFVMRSLSRVYRVTQEPRFLAGARSAARILASWVFLWDVPFPEGTMLKASSFSSTGWAVCDVIAAGSYVDNEMLEFVGDLVEVAIAAQDASLLELAEVVQYGLQGALSTPQDMLGYAAAGIQCEGLLTSYWLSEPDTTDFSGAVSKRKGDDNDTCNGLINGQFAYSYFDLLRRYGTTDIKAIAARTDTPNPPRIAHAARQVDPQLI